LEKKSNKFSPTFLALLEKRGFINPSAIESFLFSGLEFLHDPFLMKNMREVKIRIERAVQRGEAIMVHGDYDVDGITGVAIMARTLEKLGGKFTTFLPERERDGYGVSEDAIRKAGENGASLVVTVDCGITAKIEIEIARKLGMDVIVIDHHRLPAEGLPDTPLILNPIQEDCGYPFKDLSAAGLVFKLSQTLLGDGAMEFLDFVALSTISDIAPLTGENRILVKKGLELLSERKKPGIRALSEVAKMKAAKVDTGHVGFILGPRINAAGRMSSPDTALRLLLTPEPREAESLAKILDAENKARQLTEKETTQDAIRKVERTVNFNRERIIVVEGKGWHRGVIGIVASRLVEKFSRPAIVISVEEGTGRGSGRSIKGFHLFKALESCASSLEAFGGHEQAAGLTVLETKIPELREKINVYAQEHLSFEALKPRIVADMELELKELTGNFLRELALLEPHGIGNPRPSFRSRGLRARTKARRLYGETYEVVLTDGLLNYQAHLNEKQMMVCAASRPDAGFEAVYTVKTKQWNGLETLVLNVKELKE